MVERFFCVLAVLILGACGGAQTVDEPACGARFAAEPSDLGQTPPLEPTPASDTPASQCPDEGE